MVYLTNLAAVARTSGLRVVEVSGWTTRGHGQMSTPLGVVCHHTAGSASGEYPSLAVVRDGRPGLSGPLAQLGLGRSGAVYVIAAGLSYHAGDGGGYGLRGNIDTIGIEAESTGYGSWTPAQRDAYPRLCAALCRGYRISPSRVIAHREWTSRKVDPTGIDMPALRAMVTRLLTTGTDDQQVISVEAQTWFNARFEAYFLKYVGNMNLTAPPWNTVAGKIVWLQNAELAGHENYPFCVTGDPRTGAQYARVGADLVHVPNSAVLTTLRKLGAVEERSDKLQVISSLDWIALVATVRAIGGIVGCPIDDGCLAHLAESDVVPGPLDDVKESSE